MKENEYSSKSYPTFNVVAFRAGLFSFITMIKTFNLYYCNKTWISSFFQMLSPWGRYRTQSHCWWWQRDKQWSLPKRTAKVTEELNWTYCRSKRSVHHSSPAVSSHSSSMTSLHIQEKLRPIRYIRVKHRTRSAHGGKCAYISLVLWVSFWSECSVQW